MNRLRGDIALRSRRAPGPVAIACGAGATLFLLALSPTPALAAAGNPATASLSGSWVITSTVTAYTGGGSKPAAAPPVGQTSSGQVQISETCSAPDRCAVSFSAPPGSQSFFQTGLALTFAPLTLVNGAVSPVGFTSGYGGPGLQGCPRPPGPQYLLSLSVTQAVLGPNGDQAVTITGTQRDLEAWCRIPAPEYEIIQFIGHPVGYVPPAPATPLPTASPRPAASGGHRSGSTSPPGTVAHPLPSTITSSLATPADAFSSPVTIAVNAAVTVVVILFITFPANLFNKTFEENYEEIRDIAERRLPWLRSLRSRLGRGSSPSRRHLIVFVAVLLGGALLGGFLDPRFGFNGSSLTTLLSTLLSICIGIGVGTLVGYTYRRLRGDDLHMTPRALPAGLAIAVVCVVISRLSDFHPGYLYGVICGIAFTAAISKREEAHLVALGSVATLCLALLAWFAWVPLHGPASQPGAGFGLVLLDDVVGAMFVGGLVGSVIGLFPLRFLPGGTLERWSRTAWAVTFGLAVFAFLQLMLRPESTAAHSRKAALATAIALFVFFGGASVLFRYYFYRRHRRAAMVAPAQAR